MKPLLLLDFDGVLNAILGKRCAPNPDWSAWEKNKVDHYTTWTSREMAAAFTSLAETHWLTTWNEDDKANLLLSPLLKVGPFPVAAAPPLEHDSLWKPRAVALALSNRRRVVWLDDDANHLWEAWLQAAPEWKHKDLSNFFKIAPDASIGLTAAHLKMVRDWLNRGE